MKTDNILTHKEIYHLLFDDAENIKPMIEFSDKELDQIEKDSFDLRIKLWII